MRYLTRAVVTALIPWTGILKELIGGDIWKRKAVSFRPQLWNLFAERADPSVIGPRLTRLARVAASGSPKTAKPKRDNRRISNLSSDAILNNNVDFDLDQTLIPLHVDRVEIVTFLICFSLIFFGPSHLYFNRRCSSGRAQ